MMRSRRRWFFLVLALALVVQTGCALAILSVAAGGAAAGYIYYNGALARDYPSGFGETIAVAKKALGELKFPIVKEKTDTGTAYIQTKTTDGYTVTLYFNVVPSAVPSDGAMTRVAVRVGFGGDDTISTRILEQITKHIPATTPPATLPPSPAPITPTKFETSAPPLAPATGTKTALPKK